MSHPLLSKSRLAIAMDERLWESRYYAQFWGSISIDLQEVVAFAVKKD